MDDLIIARTLHALAVIMWIGGVALVTSVVMSPGRQPTPVVEQALALKATAAMARTERRFMFWALSRRR